ncbi:hypothetical protein HDU77_011246 [Chytriomyces hyalinus]|nr:hypothetical protein HDU77_011246 [Chytriomyces hyalinus]
MEQNGKITTRPKVVGGVQARRATFQGDLLRKYQVLKPNAKKVPINDLRQGKIKGVRMINWPSAVARTGSFNEKELDILQRNSVSFVESTDVVADFEDIDSVAPAAENELSFTVEDLESALDAVTGSDSSSSSTHFEIPAYDGAEGVHQSTMNLNGIDLEALSTMLDMPFSGN